MDLTNILDPLNDAQREAVLTSAQAALVLAGAGSGKTRVLVHRMAYLMQAHGVSPHSLLAVTFTNKAAGEMKNRVEHLLQQTTQGLWIGTFHGLCHRLLRRHAAEAGLPEAFQILDSDDQLRIVRRTLKALNLDEAHWNPKQVQWYINGLKEEGQRARDVPDSFDPYGRQLQQIYQTYEETCRKSGLVDFAELLLAGYELLRDRPVLLEHYSRRFHQILVDEFQDTNGIQYLWLRQLTAGRQNLFAVGDDDQSIYGWRGARVENLHSFRHDYPSHAMVRLEQNYRSTGMILNAANSLIANNSGRLGKTLWTPQGLGEPLRAYAAFNDADEAQFVVERIQAALDEGVEPTELAVLYRSNAQSRQFEERLMARRIPYRVYGGLRFFERAEIKNALAYLRLLSNPNDDSSLERVINFPARGIGDRTVEALRETARDHGGSLWEAVQRLPASGRSANALRQFAALLETLRQEAAALPLAEQVKKAIEHSGLLAHYHNERGSEGEARVDNLKELVTAARQFALEEVEAEGYSPLDAFLAHAALEAGDNQAEGWQTAVQLMTLHSAKGLEFRRVFLVGLEEGLFPSMQSLEDPVKLEEERRLCYVGITRAREQLYVTYAESRRLYGRESYPRPSRFIGEIPGDCLEEVRLGGTVSRPTAARTTGGSTAQTVRDAASEFPLGQRVRHGKWGDGVVLRQQGEGANLQVQINFEQNGIKWLMAAYAKLQML